MEHDEIEGPNVTWLALPEHLSCQGKGSHPLGSGHPPQSLLRAMGLGRALPDQGDRDPTWPSLLQVPLQEVGWGRGDRGLAAGWASELGS